MKKAPLLVILFVIILFAETPWNQVDDGLQYAYFESITKSVTGDSKVCIVKIDPEQYEFKLLSAKELNHDALTAPEWVKKYNLVLAFNAGMFKEDYKTNVGYMRNYNAVNNGKSNSYKSVAAFNPKTAGINRARIFDLEKTPLDSINGLYNTVIQNLRLIKRPGVNVWAKQNKKWSEVAVGQDAEGNIIVAYSRSPYSMEEFNKILLNLPLRIQCLQHLEGGPEASLCLRSSNAAIDLMGSYETGFYEADDNKKFYPIPNVIGVVKREKH